MNIVKPTKQQIEWADCEIGVIIHLDMCTFSPYDWREKWGWNPPLEGFNPSNLDTDQWLQAAASVGAKYAVLTAKHCSGFSLWPTKCHDYSVKNTPWRNGQGDIVKDFIASCKKYNIRPGIYCSVSANAYFGVDNPGIVVGGTLQQQQAYNEMVLSQLTELWTDYGELFEIWFDGGCVPVEKGGPDILSLMKKYQPNAVVFLGPKGTTSLVRWIGNECGTAHENCWATIDFAGEDYDNEKDVHFDGSPFGKYWAPAECDMPNRDSKNAFSGGWFWKADEEQYVFSGEYLLERYYESVGRNANLLIGMGIDNTGLFPQKDTEEFLKFAELVENTFYKKVAETKGSSKEFILETDEVFQNIVISENISEGEHVLHYEVTGYIEGWETIYVGENIGHKRIIKVPNGKKYSKVQLQISKTKDSIISIRDFSLWSSNLA